MKRVSVEEATRFLKYNLVCNYIVFMPNARKHDIYHYIFGDITEK